MSEDKKLVKIKKNKIHLPLARLKQWPRMFLVRKRSFRGKRGDRRDDRRDEFEQRI